MEQCSDLQSIRKLRSMAVKVGLLNIFSIQHNETQVGDYMQRHHSILGRSSTESTQCCVACAVNQGQGQIKTKLA